MESGDLYDLRHSLNSDFGYKFPHDEEGTIKAYLEALGIWRRIREAEFPLRGIPADEPWRLPRTTVAGADENKYEIIGLPKPGFFGRQYVQDVRKLLNDEINTLSVAYEHGFQPFVRRTAQTYEMPKGVELAVRKPAEKDFGISVFSPDPVQTSPFTATHGKEYLRHFQLWRQFYNYSSSPISTSSLPRLREEAKRRFLPEPLTMKLMTGMYSLPMEKTNASVMAESLLDSPKKPTTQSETELCIFSAPSTMNRRWNIPQAPYQRRRKHCKARRAEFLFV